MRRALTVLAVAASFAGPVPASRADEVDDYLRAAIETNHIPGLAVAVVKDGKPLFERQYGLANLETDTPVAKDSIFPFYSISKQFTTAATMLLVEEGKVGLDDKASKYLDKLPPAWEGVTVRHLLTATSGIPEYTRDFPLGSAGLERVSFAKVIQTTGAKSREFQPGEKWAYCNTGFWMLSQIVAGRAGKPYQEFLQARIFTPLGMTATRRGSARAVVPHRVSGYDLDSGRWVNASGNPPGEGDGDLIGPLSDPVKWDVAVTAGKIVRPETLTLIQTVAKLNDNKPAEVKVPLPRLPQNIGYGMGCFIGTYHGRRVVWTPGAGPGYSTSLTRFPDDRVTVIVLCNLGSFALADELARGIGEHVIPGLKGGRPRTRP
jgi:D-alanyl-D-alanine carboxypeptidase